MRNRIRACQAGDAKCIRAWRLGIFFMRLKWEREGEERGRETRKDRFFRKERDEREEKKEKDWEKERRTYITSTQVTSRVRATQSNRTFEFSRLLRNARGENSEERQRLESRRRLNVSHARDIEWLWILSENDERRLWRRSSQAVARMGRVSNAPQIRHTVKTFSIQKAIVRKCMWLSILLVSVNVSFTEMENREDSLQLAWRKK